MSPQMARDHRECFQGYLEGTAHTEPLAAEAAVSLSFTKAVPPLLEESTTPVVEEDVLQEEIRVTTLLLSLSSDL